MERVEGDRNMEKVKERGRDSERDRDRGRFLEYHVEAT